MSDRRDRRNRNDDRERRGRDSSRRRHVKQEARSRSRSPHDVEDIEEKVNLADLITSGDRGRAQQEIELLMMRKRDEVESWRQQKKRDQYTEEKEKKETK